VGVRAATVIRAKALSVTAVANLLGARIYSNTAIPENTAFPYVELKLESSEHPHHMSGPSGWAMVKVIAKIYAHSNASAEAVAEALRIGMHPFKGTVTVSAQSIAVGYLGLESEMEDPEPLQDGKQRPVYGIQQTWSACIAEPTS
jgi:hypothetical protein